MTEARQAIIWRRGDELTAHELYALLTLRVDVFVVEQECAYPELDGQDLLDTTYHGYVTDEAGVTATVRLLTGETPARVGRVVTRFDARGAGLAEVLVHAAHGRCAGAGSMLDAQTHLVDWYTNLGWSVAGSESIEDGIPHTPMQRDVDTRL